MRRAWVVVVVTVAAGAGWGCSSDPAPPSSSGPPLQDTVGAPFAWESQPFEPTERPWPDCATFPEFHTPGAIVQASADERTGRTYLPFIDVTGGRGDGPDYYVILYWHEDYRGCAEPAKEIVRGGLHGSPKVRQHLCEQMLRIASGGTPTDSALAGRTAASALAYLDTFCLERALS